MTPKEKAKELVNKFKEQDTKGILFTADFNPKREQRILDKAKSCALIAVDEMIAELAYVRNYDEEIDEKMIIKIDQRQDFLIEVEKEIKAL